MSFQGNLRDFSVSEILQLLGTQKKSGCLVIEWEDRRTQFYMHEGRIVSTRLPGMSKDDPLLRFLLKVHRLSNEQYRGLITIQRESNRDLEDLLVNGRYLDAAELGLYIERQILDDLMKVMGWENGSYQFDPHSLWPRTPLARLGVEAALIEVARRVDERQQFSQLFMDPHQLVVVQDLPDADEHLSEDECELFGIIDGRHTLAEIVEEAPLSEYEAYEALHRMNDARWIAISGRRDPGVVLGADAEPPPAPLGGPDLGTSRPMLTRELVIGVVTVVVTLAFTFAARPARPVPPGFGGGDVFAAAQERDVRLALTLYRRERGQYPERLEHLAADGWIAGARLRQDGRAFHYRAAPDGQSYVLQGPTR